MKLDKKNNKIKTTTYELNTSLLPILDVDLYSREQYDTTYYIEELDEIITDISHDYIKGTLISIFQKINKHLNLTYDVNDINLMDIEIKSVYHPREYNFSGDELDFNLTIDPQYIQTIIDKLPAKEFSQFLKDNYSSYDGFISFMANNLTDFDNQNHNYQIAQIIMFYIKKLNFNLENIQEAWDYEFYQNL